MSVLRNRTPGSRSLLLGGFAVTVVLHAGIVAPLIAGRANAERVAPAAAFGQVVEVQAVKFGKPRDMHFLPHKEAPPVHKAPPKIALSSSDTPVRKQVDKEEKPEEKPDRLITDHARQFAQLNDNNNDPDSTGSAVEEGDPNGMRGGTATVGKGPVYYQHLQAAVQNAWNIPTTIPDAELGRLKAMLCVKIEASGKIVEFAIRTPSGNDRFDATLKDAIGSIQQFEPPTADVKDQVTGDGVCMNFAYKR
jgi:hypothetical protein